MDRDLAIREIPERLAALLNASASEIDLAPVEDVPSFGTWDPNLLLQVDEFTFAVEYKSSSRAEQVGSALRVIESASELASVIPLLVVPFMGDVGRRLCKEAEIAWMDLSGNAWIHRPGVHISVEGKENRFKKRGRPANLFAPKSSRLVRLLLMKPEKRYWQQELAKRADVHRSHVSRVVGRLLDSGFVERAEDGSVKVRDPGLLLDAWSEAYEIREHRVREGHMASRSSEEALSRLAEAFDRADVEYGATGLPAGWLYTRHAGYRLVTVYIERRVQRSVLEQAGWRDEERGANVWLLEADDIGVFHGVRMVDGVRCVHPVQAYVDLQCLPERAGEMAAVLRREVLGW